MLITILKNLIITPIEIIFDAIFCYLQNSPGRAIIAISIVMNFLALPLYQRADAIQEEERRKAASMSGWVNRIKETFKGDEQYMMLTEYYRVEHYKPVYALRSFLPLLLQIPFFIAAYHYLSTQTLLSASSFLFLEDLGQPDRLLKIGAYSINVMPIVMTLINGISAFIYLRGAPVKDKIQTYGIAVIFLVLLYNSPSGLVFYWTLNQIFSVAKNVFMKLVKKQEVRNRIFLISGTLAVVFLAAIGCLCTRHRRIIACGILLCSCLPMIVTTVKSKAEGKIEPAQPMKSGLFFMGAIFLSLFLGVMIPLAVIYSDPMEFVTAITSPASLVLNNFSIFLGFFAFWLGIYYFLSKTRIRNIFSTAVWLLAAMFLVNYFFFAGDYGIMSSDFEFNNSPVISRNEAILNAVVMILLTVAGLFIFKKWKRVVSYAYVILILTCIGLSSYYGIGIAGATRTPDAGAGNGTASSQTVDTLHLKKDGKNVVVIVADMAFGGYVPFIFDEKPELKEQFNGFSFYPNTLSYGSSTKEGIPGLYGGHEYSPSAMNQRADELLADKHDEALSVMPALFSENGFNVTVWGTPLAGYGNADKSAALYSFDENIKKFSLDSETYVEPYYQQFGSSISRVKSDRLVFYCLFRTLPSVMRSTIYNDGNYWQMLDIPYSENFISYYASLSALSQITKIDDSGDNSFIMLYNQLPHFPAFLPSPEYALNESQETDLSRIKYSKRELGNRVLKLDSLEEVNTYSSNVASYMLIGEWLEYLKEQGVYDNTRIIIVSDHGTCLLRDQIEGSALSSEEDVEALNCLLMVKDFDSKSDFTVSEEFHMNADVPYIAAQGVVQDFYNPFTGKRLNTSENISSFTISHVGEVRLNQQAKLFDTTRGTVWSVRKGDVYDIGNWSLVG